jgi:hypothetical protein
MRAPEAMSFVFVFLSTPDEIWEEVKPVLNPECRFLIALGAKKSSSVP